MITLIRCDASREIGSGHVVRCLTLARELACNGVEVIFVSRTQDGDLREVIKKEFRVLALPILNHDSFTQETEDGPYEKWLGCTQEEDAADCLSALRSIGINQIDWIIVDHYGLDWIWEQKVLRDADSKSRPKLLVIDDLANRHHIADVLLDQNYHGALGETRYTGLVSKQCRLLTGPAYSLLRPEYAQLKGLVPKRRLVRRVLVFFGGSDPANLTSKAVMAMMEPQFNDIEVDVVLGQQAANHKQVQSLIEQRERTYLHHSLPSLAGLIARADLAIGACGSSTWERLCLGLPSIVITFGEDQKKVAEPLSREGYVSLIGDEDDVTLKRIVEAVNCHIIDGGQSPDRADLTDGFGTRRVAITMLGGPVSIQLRQVLPSDEGILLHWANNAQVRNNSFSPSEIKRVDHGRWFKQILQREDRLQLVAETRDGVPLGQIRFDLMVDVDSGLQRAKVDISIDACARGLNISSELVCLGVLEMQRRWGKDVRVVAEVFDGNTASNRCFQKAGFSLVYQDEQADSFRRLNVWALE